MNLLERTSVQSILFFILYGGAATLCVVLCLCFRDERLIYDTGYSPGNVIGAVLDCVSLLITIAGTLIAMLPQLPHLQPRLPAAHRPERHRVAEWGGNI